MRDPVRRGLMLEKQRVAADLDEFVFGLRSRGCKQRIRGHCHHGLPGDDAEDSKEDEKEGGYRPLGFPIQAYRARHIYLAATIGTSLPLGFLPNKREVAHGHAARALDEPTRRAQPVR